MVTLSTKADREDFSDAEERRFTLISLLSAFIGVSRSNFGRGKGIGDVLKVHHGDGDQTNMRGE